MNDDIGANGSNKVKGGFGFVVRGIRIVGLNRGRADRKRTNLREHNNPAQAFHGRPPSEEKLRPRFGRRQVKRYS